jgi:hypothetical protein
MVTVHVFELNSAIRSVNLLYIRSSQKCEIVSLERFIVNKKLEVLRNLLDEYYHHAKIII